MVSVRETQLGMELKQEALELIRRLEDAESPPSFEAVRRVLSRIGKLVDDPWNLFSDSSPWPGLFLAHGLYALPTSDFLNEISEEIFRRGFNSIPSIEICAGRGAISRHLQKQGMNILPIDNASDSLTRGKSLVQNVKSIDHRDALKKYQPKLVVGCWIPTFPEIGQDILDFPSVDYFLDIGETAGGATWLESGFDHPDFKRFELKNIQRYTVASSDYIGRKLNGDLEFVQHSEARLWKRKGAKRFIS